MLNRIGTAILGFMVGRTLNRLIRFKKERMKLPSAIGLIFLSISLGFAQDVDTVNPDRPSFSTSTHTVAKGEVQIEGGFTRLRSGSAVGYDVGQILVRDGVSKRVELRVGVPSYEIVDVPEGRATGADDVLVETKVLLMSRKRVALGALASASFPTGSREVAEHTFQPGATLITDITVSDAVSVTCNAGYSRATTSGLRYNSVSGVSTANVSLSSTVSAFTEFFAFNQFHDRAQKYVGVGAALRIGKRASIDASGGFGIRNRFDGPDRYFGAGISLVLTSSRD